MKIIKLVPLIILGFVSCQSGPRLEERRPLNQGSEPVSPRSLQNQAPEKDSDFIASVEQWAEPARNNAMAMFKKYGLPNEVNENFAVWLSSAGPWKRITAFRGGAQHHFPKPHFDLLTQVVDMRVPLDKVEDLIKFNGSILIDRTRGEVAVRCENELMNLHVINLAREIVEGRMTADQARMNYGQAAGAFVTSQDLADPDRSVVR